MGRVEPEGGVLVVTAPYFASRPSLVAELKVRQGERVRAAQLLAVLDCKPQVEAALQQAQARAATARARLQQVQAEPKAEDVAALEQERLRWESVLENARTEAQRYAELQPFGAVSASATEEKKLAVAAAERRLEETTYRIRSLREVRSADVDVAGAELNAALTDEERVRKELATCDVRSPADGFVLALRARQGEEIGPRGLLELARTAKMYAIAEVYEGDIARVHVGQLADISGDALPHAVSGTVERIDSQVGSPETLPVDPTAYADQRVINVYLRSDDPASLDHLIHARVSVVFKP